MSTAPQPIQLREVVILILTTSIGVFLSILPDLRWLGYGVIVLCILYLMIAIGRWREYGRLTARPHIDFQIHEAYIVPYTNTANCFLRVSLHNEIGPPTANPPSSTYALDLTIKGKQYNSTSPLEPESYELGAYKLAITYDDYDPEESLVLLTTEPLYSVSSRLESLVPGTRIFGWIGFAVHYLPTWETDSELIGTRIEYSEYLEHGEPVEESAKSVEKYREVKHTRTVEKLRLTVTDAFGQIWFAERVGPFASRERGILARRKGNY